MREIKFRAWFRETKMMSNGFDPFADFHELTRIGLQNADLMQFTGLKDKNGKEIYEGDVVLIENERFVVEWGLRAWEFVRPDRRGEYQHGEITPLGADTEVIGNIYENPELISKEV